MAQETTCPLWGTPAAILEEYRNRDGRGVDSPRAGGRFFISSSAEINLKSADEIMRVKLSHEIVDHNGLGSTPEIMTSTIDGLSSVRLPGPQERADRLLNFLVRQSRHLGQTLDHFSVGHTSKGEGYIYFGTKTGPNAWPLFAWSDSTDDDEVAFLLEMLAESGAIRTSDKKPIPDVVVLPRGYELVRTSSGEIQLDQAFVAMWFDASVADAYSQGIEAAIRATGYRPLRIDQKEHINKIDDEIIAEIRRSRFVVADFTSQPNMPRGLL